MKTVGVIGGIGPESTIEYYRLLVAAYRAQKPDGSYPPVIINSINLKAVVDLLEANNLAGVTDCFVAEIEKLAGAGAECGLLAANTPHIVFDEIRRRSPIPLVSIVEATCEAARLLGLKRLACWALASPCKEISIRMFFPKQKLRWLCPNLTSRPTFTTSTWANW